MDVYEGASVYSCFGCKYMEKTKRYATPYLNINKKLVLFGMIDKQQAELIQLRFGLTLKLILDENKSKAIDNPKKDIIDSYGKLETSSGLRKATLIDFASGKSNPTGTTIAAILEALELSLSEFGGYYDRITEKDITEYKKEIEKARKERARKKLN